MQDRTTLITQFLEICSVLEQAQGMSTEEIVETFNIKSRTVRDMMKEFQTLVGIKKNKWTWELASEDWESFLTKYMPGSAFYGNRHNPDGDYQHECPNCGIIFRSSYDYEIYYCSDYCKRSTQNSRFYNQHSHEIIQSVLDRRKKKRDEDNMNEALQEFQRIASSTEGYQGSSYKSSNGYEFVIWVDEGDDHPQPESELIQWSVDLDDDTYEDMYKFSMTLPYAEAQAE